MSQQGGRQFRRRFDGEREAKVDYFDADGTFQSERESLGGTEAATLTEEVHDRITPDGLQMNFNCNCGTPVGLVVTWSEVGAIAHGINPSEPGLGVTETRWLFDNDENGFYPEVPCSKCTYEKRKLILTKDEMGKRFDAARRLGFDRLDPSMPRLGAFVQNLRAAAAQQQRGAIQLGQGQRR